MKVLASDYDGTLLFNEQFKEGDLKKIKELQKNTFDYCGEMFDIYDENGKVDIDEES